MTEKRKNDDLTLWSVIMDKLRNADGADLFLIAASVFLVVFLFIALILTTKSEPSEVPAIAQLAAFMTDCRAQEITQATCERLAIEFFGG